jgi:hypothetical protein
MNRHSYGVSKTGAVDDCRLNSLARPLRLRLDSRPQPRGQMPDLKDITISVTSIEAGKGGNGIVMVRFTNPFEDADFFLRVPVQNLDKPTSDILKEAQTKVATFTGQLSTAAGYLRFSQ